MQGRVEGQGKGQVVLRSGSIVADDKLAFGSNSGFAATGFATDFAGGLAPRMTPPCMAASGGAGFAAGAFRFAAACANGRKKACGRTYGG